MHLNLEMLSWKLIFLEYPAETCIFREFSGSVVEEYEGDCTLGVWAL
jgi:hypothetical protein